MTPRAVRCLLSAPAALLATLLVPAPAQGQVVLHVDPSVDDCEVRFAPNLTQEAFGRFVREFGSVSSVKQGAQPATLGAGEVAVGVEYLYFRVDEASAAWNDTFVHPDATHWLGAEKTFPKLRLRVGVTDQTDLGLDFSMNPDANYGWLAIDVKHALLRQGDRMPVTLALRAAYTKTLFVKDMDMHSLSLGLSAGRTFWGWLTPYLGVGADAVLARETSSAVALQTEKAVAPYALAGVELAFWRMRAGIEAQYGALPSAQAQLSIVF